METKIRHLEMIQGIINRMAANSFSLKGWAVTLVAGLMVLSDKNAEHSFFLIVYIPIIIFWFLDSYYLLQEKKYRGLYECVRHLKESEIDFNMSPMNLENKNTILKCMLSSTEMIFYLPLIVLTSVIIGIVF